MIAHRNSVQLTEFELDLQLELPAGESPVEVVQLVLVYSEGPADGVVEAELSEPSLEGFGRIPG